MSKYNDTETISRVMTLSQALEARFATIDREREQNFNMTVSRLQWSKDDKSKLDQAGRPAHAYNIISPILKVITGLERMNRKKVQFVGRTKDDLDGATLINNVIDWIYAQTNFDYHKSRVILDALIGRWGFIYQNWSYEQDPEGMLDLHRVNPFTVRFDLDFTDITFRDCKFIETSDWLTAEDIIARYCVRHPDMEQEIAEKAGEYFHDNEARKKTFISTVFERLRGAAGRLINRSDRDAINLINANQSSHWYDPLTGKFRVTTVHERRRERRCLIYVPGAGIQYDITKKAWNAERKIFDDEIIAAYREKLDGEVSFTGAEKICCTAVVPAFEMVLQDAPYPVQNGNFMYTPFFAYDFHADIAQTQSVVDELIDPQSSYNKRRSTLLEIVTRYASLGWTGEEGAIAGFEDEWENRKIGSMKTIKKGYWGKIQPDPVPGIPQAIFQYEQEDMLLTDKISGVNQANKGYAESSGESGALFKAKAAQGELMLTYLFDNMEQSVLIIARNTLDFMQRYMDEERTIRITTDEGDEEHVTLNEATPFGKLNDVTVGKYDVQISTMPYGRTAREIEYFRLLDMIKFSIEVFPAAAPKLLPILFKASDTPHRSEILKALNEMTGSADGQGAPVDPAAQAAMAQQQQAAQQAQQLQLQQVMMQLEKMRADTERVKAEADKVQLENIQTASDIRQQRRAQANDEYDAIMQQMSAEAPAANPGGE